MSPKDQKKKEQEIAWIKQFKSHFYDFPIGEEQEDSESPDYKIHTSNGTVGIEVTKILIEMSSRGSVRKEQESIQDKILRYAQEIHTQNNGSKLLLWARFDNSVILRSQQQNTIAQELVRTISEIEQVVTTQGNGLIKANRRQHKKLFGKEFPAGINELSWAYVSHPDAVAWTTKRGCVRQALTIEIIKQAIERKENEKCGKQPKIQIYKKSCDWIWLLIVAEGHAPSSGFVIPDLSKNYDYKSQFDRIFVMDSCMGSVTPLKTAPIQLPPEGEELLGSS